MRKIFLISILIYLTLISATYKSYGLGSELVYSNEIKKKSIHTVQIYPIGWELAVPVIELKGDNQLLFSFDEIKENIQDYSYKIIHCDKNWLPSGLSEFDYLEGFSENQIADFEHSFNTNVNYIHYSLKIPNNDVSLKLSGNYIIEVFEDFDPEKVIIRQRFMILDSRVEISGIVKHPVSIDLRNSHQEVDFSVFHPNFLIDNPQSDLSVVLTQNNRLDGTEKKLKPIFIRKDELVFDYQHENVFEGGNEFRHFDLKSLRYQTRFIREITKENDTTSVLLSPALNRHFNQYIFDRDINGNYLVEVQERDNPATEADYAYITFTLQMDNELKHGDFYVHGNFNNWQCNSRNKMHYDYDKNAYVSKIFMKQGYYNYQFALVDHKSKIPDTGYIEGNHWETENDYVVLVYYHDIALNYDMLIGYKTIKSTERF
jgi:hypothetical protein